MPDGLLTCVPMFAPGSRLLVTTPLEQAAALRIRLRIDIVRLVPLGWRSPCMLVCFPLRLRDFYYLGTSSYDATFDCGCGAVVCVFRRKWSCAGQSCGCRRYEVAADRAVPRRPGPRRRRSSRRSQHLL